VPSAVFTCSATAIDCLKLTPKRSHALRETDFDRFALAGPSVETYGRNLLLTIDFEAFNHENSLDLWLHALRRWAHHSADRGWGFSIFIALEDVVQLRFQRPDRYQEFLEGLKILHRSGAAFFPHNHGVFDRHTGEQAQSRPQRLLNYPKRASFFYDVVRRHRIDLREWFSELLAHYDQFLEEAGLPRPERTAFRAGGWDHGATREESSLYIDAVCDAEFAYDSSVTGGNFGTKDFRIGAPFGMNTFVLTPTLTEVAPCLSYDCGASWVSRASLSTSRHLLGQPQVWGSRKRPGAFVVVLHFDHLFRQSNRGENPSLRAVNQRIDRFFSVMSRVKKLLHFSEVPTFDQLSLQRPHSET
jgi:hypothetical protein